MGLHKLTAGDGYTYLTRQVAVHDTTDRGHTGLADYYTEKGESPGRWWGSGLATLGVDVRSNVTEQQMRNLFGEGRHPDAERLEDDALNTGASVTAAKQASQLGRVFAVYKGNTPEFQQEVARRFSAYNYEHGLRWSTPVPAPVRARIRTELAVQMFTREHGRAPLDDRERAGYLAQATRQQTTAVAGYDLTFTPVKSVSTLWAVADRDTAQQVEAAHHAAVDKTLAWLEQEVLFTRRGRGGIQQVKAAGLIAAQFTHRDARSGDPHLHTHVAISNKVQDQTGRWLAVDGRVLYKANVTLSETYNSLLEAELVDRLGVRFTARPAGLGPGRSTSRGVGQGKRVVREIDGIDPRLAAGWSSRNHAIEARRRQLATDFQAEHGRPPTAGEAVALTKQAWSQTRQAKHAPRAEADQRAVWRAEAERVLGSREAVRAMVEASTHPRRGTPNAVAGVGELTDEWVQSTAAAVVETVQEDRATWQVWHLRAEALRRIRDSGIHLDDLEATADRIVDTAVSEHCITFDDPDPLLDAGRSRAGVTVPAELIREDGTSVYSVHGARLYTSRAIVDAEQRILAAAQCGGGRTISDAHVAAAITAADSPAGSRSPDARVVLNAAQRSLVYELATSGRRVQLALAPAGTGKTTAMAALSRAWRASGGTVVGLAPSAVAAEQLLLAINIDASTAADGAGCETLAKLVWHLDHGDEPAWMRDIDERTLVVIDEAAMASTTELAAAIDYVTARGGSVRLVGDDRQLASVAAGGVLRDIAHQVGAVTLDEVRRFRNRDGSVNHAEAAASLALRDGDPAALGFYADRARIHVGDLATSADQAYAAWAADRSSGVDSLLLAPTHDLVNELNTRAREDRLATTNPDPADRPSGPVLVLGDGTNASAGDPVITRSNERRLAISNTDWVKNGDRWTLTHVHPGGSATVRHNRHGRQIRLPADYVAEHLQLGYATTVHGAQGVTVDTCHVVLTGQEDRNLLYVALSRGQYASHMYLATATDGDPHTLIRPESLTPPTAIDQLTAILRRDGSPISATTELRDAADPATLLRDSAARYHDALTTAAEQLIGPAAIARIDQHAETLLAGTAAGLIEIDGGLTDAAAWPTLRSHLALLALDDHDPLALLSEAVHSGPLTGARDTAAVLDARIASRVTGTKPHKTDTAATAIAAADTSPTRRGPLPWLPGLPPAIASDLDWGPYLMARHQQVHDRASAITDIARAWGLENPSTAPAWAQPFLDHSDVEQDNDADLLTQLALWRAATRTPDTDLRPTGEPTIGTPGAYQATLNRAARAVLSSHLYKERSWHRLLPENVRNDPWATTLCDRIGHLERAGAPVDEYLGRALATSLDDVVGHALELNMLSAEAVPPLPDQHPAAALWWRIVTQAGATAVEACTYDSRRSGASAADGVALSRVDPTDASNHLGADSERDVGTAEPDSQFAFPDPDEVPVDRILELNQQALDYYEARYPLSWAPDYLRERLGTDLITDLMNDLSDHSTLTAGYAPPGPRSLLNHLTSLGARLEELEQAGLIRARERRDGTTEHVDVFRDRLVLPIRDPHTPSVTVAGTPVDTAPVDIAPVLGFVGRRNPTKSDDDYAGPKYLNTKTTPVFVKGQALFGYAEARAALDAGALPVIVEGPLDAYAITLASHGDAVGLAPMGTALTTAQITILRRHLSLAEGRTHIAVAYDADPAGWTAAQTAFWNLTAADLDPTHLALPREMDPATLLQSNGPDAIRAAINDRIPLGGVMLDELLRTAGSWVDPKVRQHIVEQASFILAARGPDTWTDEIEWLNRRLHLSTRILEHHTLTHSINRDHNPAGYTAARIAELKTLTPRRVTTRPSPAAPFIYNPSLKPVNPTPPPATWSIDTDLGGPSR